MRRAALAAVLLAGCGGGAGGTSEPAPAGSGAAAGFAGVPRASDAAWFTDVTAAAGVDFVHDAGFTEERHLPETMGGGGALFDADGDGDLDLYCVQSGPLPVPETAPRSPDAPPSRLYLGDGRGQLADATAASGAAAFRGYGQGCAVGDADGDGREDLYVTAFGPDALLRNVGGARFEDATAAAGLGDPRWTAGASFFDADADGDLDLYVTGYLAVDVLNPVWCGRREPGWRSYCHPDEYPGIEDRYWRNDGGRFVLANEAAGLVGTEGKGLGVLPVDVELDGDLDLYVANDSTENRLWRNRGDGTFEDATLESGTGVNVDGMTEAGMGLAAGDVDGDLDLDLFVTNFDNESNTLYANEGGGVFADQTVRAGLEAASRMPVGWGTVLADLDLDGDLDAPVANGHIIHNIHLYHDGKTWAQRALLSINRGDGRFADGGPELGDLGARPFVGRGLLAGDLDSDGDADLVVLECGGPARVLRNDAGNGRRALVVDGLPPHAVVRATLSDGTRRLLVAGPQPTYYGACERAARLGLGAAEVASLELVGPGTAGLVLGRASEPGARVERWTARRPAGR